MVSSIICCVIDTRAQQKVPYLDSTLSIEARITDLLPRLTLEEKVIQLSDSWGSKGIPRLKVPTMLKTEGLHGQSYSMGATIFPQAIAMASSFDTALVHTIGSTTAVESKAAGLRVTWSPVLDVARDVRWGRVEETYGEDPYLVSRMGVAWINGFQQEGMIAVPKHFAGHGEPLGGRDSHDVGLSDRTMRNVHLVPFRAAIKEAHAGGVMAAYSTWDAVPDNGSTELLQKILREEWGFDGIVVSDCSAPENFYRKQSVVYNLDEAAKMAILAGVDIECGSVNAFTLAGAIKRGVLRESDLDVNLRRVFRAKYRLGLFDRPGPDKMIWEKLPAYDTPPHRALAREAAIKGSVLLKNDRSLLPLSKDIRTIAVIGPNADMAQTGDYSAKAAAGQLVTVLQGIKSHVSAGTKVLFEKGCNVQSMDSSGFDRAVDAASKADAIVLVVGDYSNNNPAIEDKENTTTGENKDGATLEIPGVQRRLIRRIAATGKPVALVLVNGKPFTLTWEAEHIAAILETWYPGEEGGNATADILFGDANPSGRLPVSFPRHVGQLPLRYDYAPSGRNYDYYDMPFTPLYRFGHGLSYTTFNYSDLGTVVNGDGTVSVSAGIENTGNREGEEVVQLYLTDVVSSVITPVITLQGFQRVHLDKGEKKTIAFRLSPYQLSLLNASMERVVEPGKFRVHVGGVSPEPPSGNSEHKLKIGYKDPKQGVSGEFDIKTSYKASFTPSMQAPANVKGGVVFPVTVTLTNEGNITDVADIKIYGETLLDDYRSEIDPAQTVTHTFNITLYKSGQQNITLIVGKKLITWPVSVAQSPANLSVEGERLTISDGGVLNYEALAINSGSLPYRDSFQIMVNDKPAVSEPITLLAGEKRAVEYSYAFPASGAYRVRIGKGSEQRLLVPGGVGLALQNPLLYLDFDQADTKDRVSGASLKVQGASQFVDDKAPKSVLTDEASAVGLRGKAFYSTDKKTFISGGGLDLYRKSFTLASWVKVDGYENGQAMFFGGQAPMGADIDNAGTVLAAGVQNEVLLLSFQDRDIKGSARVPTGQWVHLAYTYDAENNEGALYINGRQDKRASQKPYTGPLDMIGGAPRFGHGRFAMDEVLVARNCLSPENIKELAVKGISGLRNGEVVTEWRDIKTAVAMLRYTARIPVRSTAVLIIETEGEDHQPLASKTIVLKDGDQVLALEGLKGARARIKIALSATGWAATPAVQSVVLGDTEGDLARWSFTAEWEKATISGGLAIGQMD